MKSRTSSAGSPKKCCADCSSNTNNRRWIAPTEAVETLPYSAESSLARSDTLTIIARRSFRSRIGVSSSRARRKAMLSTPSCVSFRFSSAKAAAGPSPARSCGSGGPARRTGPRTRPGRLRRYNRQSRSSARDRPETAWLARHRQPGDIAFHIRAEHRHALRGEALGEDLQRHRLARAGRPGDEAVAVRQLKQQMLRFLAFADEDAIGFGPSCAPLARFDCLYITAVVSTPVMGSAVGRNSSRKRPPCPQKSRKCRARPGGSWRNRMLVSAPCRGNIVVRRMRRGRATNGADGERRRPVNELSDRNN